MGEPGMEALDPVLLATLPVHPLRRARLWNERLARGGPVAGTVDCGPRRGCRSRSARLSTDAAGQLTGCGRLHSVRDSSPRAHLADDSLWRVRAWRPQARRPACGSDVPCND